jgi:hypothetical protein
MTRLLYYPDYTGGNPYQKLLYKNTSLTNSLCVGPGSLFDAINIAKDGEACIFHQHWINAYFQGLKTEKEAMHIVTDLKYRLQYFRSLGGTIVWTIHNTINHASRFTSADKALRHFLAVASDLVHIHETAHFSRVSYLGINPLDVVICPHPSYFGYYGDFQFNQRLTQVRHASSRRTALFLGSLRVNKDPSAIVAMANHLAEKGFRVTIAGMPEDSSVLNILTSGLVESENLHLLLRRLTENEIHELCSNHNIGMISYDEILTSGTIELYNSYGMACIDCRSLQGGKRSLDALFLRLSEIEDSENLAEILEKHCINSYFQAIEKSGCSFLNSHPFKSLLSGHLEGA